MISFEIFYLSLMAWISVYGVHRFWLVWGARRSSSPQPVPVPISTAEELSDSERAERFPRVLVQLPIYNEPAVIERLLRSAADLDWPRDRLEIQVLDDSTDGSSDEVAQRVEALRVEGVPIVHLHRTDRSGFKAGALQAGLEQTEAEFVAMFDADFVPPPDFLVRALPEFARDERLAMVQGRWGFLNSRANWLTRLQSTLLDGHFHVEHRARANDGRFFNFNGTAGVWRIAAIRDSGGWRSDTITEDLELSLRAWLRGWSFRYRPDLVVPSELPERMAAFRTQQNRWVAGSMHTAVSWLGPILRSGRPFREKLDLAFYLTGNLNYLLLLLLVFAVPPAVLLRLGGDTRWLWADIPFFLFATGSVVAFYGRTCAPEQSRARFYLTRIPGLMALGLGMTVHNSRAVFRGVLGRARVFERTPKEGAAPDRRRRRRLPGAGVGGLAEFVMAAYVLSAVAISVRGGSLVSVPLLGLFAAGYLLIVWAAIGPRSSTR